MSGGSIVPYHGGGGVGPAEVQGAVGEGLHAVVEGHQAGQRAREGCVVVDGHLVEGRAAPAARVLKPARHASLPFSKAV